MFLLLGDDIIPAPAVIMKGMNIIIVLAGLGALGGTDLRNSGVGAPVESSRDLKGAAGAVGAVGVAVLT
jgi:hypothetical protein